jgi:hypothetical protein
MRELACKRPVPAQPHRISTVVIDICLTAKPIWVEDHMKQLFAVLISAFALCVNATAQKVSTSDLVKITGFSNGVYSVGRETAAQLMKNVIAPIKEKLSHSPNSEITINVQGCASENGSAATNSTAGQARATNVEGFLEQQLRQYPNVKFKPWSNGSAANSWEVVVSWTVVVPVSPGVQANNNAAHSSRTWLYAAIIIAMIVFVLALFVKKSRASNRALIQESVVASPAPATVIEMPVRTESTIKASVIGVRPDGRKCRAFITPQGPVFMTPFLSQKEPRNPIFRKDYRKAVSATIQCIENPLYQSEIDALIADGKIEEVAS